MTSERPRRRRRPSAPAATLPRPVAPAPGPSTLPQRSHITQPRQHHITKDYRYIRRDLLTIVVVSLIALGFIGLMTVVAR